MQAEGWARPAASPVVGGRSARCAGAVAAAAAFAGAVYALGSYRLDDPTVLPIAAAGLVAVALGLWRLEYGLALLIVLTPFAENAPIAEPGHARLRVALVAWAMVLVAIQAVRSVVAGREARRPAGLRRRAWPSWARRSPPSRSRRPRRPPRRSSSSSPGSVFIYLLIALFLDDWQIAEADLRRPPARRPDRQRARALAVLRPGTSPASGSSARPALSSTACRRSSRTRTSSPGSSSSSSRSASASTACSRAGSPRPACVLLPFLALPAAILTYSRGVLVALVALILVLARSKRAWPAIAAAAVLVVLLAPAAWHDRVADVGRLDRPEIATRLDFWDAALSMFQENPALGVGLNSFDVAYVDLEHDGPELPARERPGPARVGAQPLPEHARRAGPDRDRGALPPHPRGGPHDPGPPTLGRPADPRLRAGASGSGDRPARLEPLRRDLRRPEDLDARLDDPGRRRGAPAHRRSARRRQCE